MKTLYAESTSSQYGQKRFHYHLAFGRDPFERILNRLISNALIDGRDIHFLMILRHDLQNLIDKISYTVKETEFYSFNDEQIQLHFSNDEQLFNSEFYTNFLVTNFLEQAKSLNAQSSTDCIIIKLLQLNNEEEGLLKLYATKNVQDIQC